MSATDAATITAQVRAVLDSDGRVAFAYLFGSSARGTATDASDVDLAVYLAGDVALRDEARLQAELGDALGGEVDLVILNRAPLWLQFRVLGEGAVVFSRDEAERVAFRERVERSFLDFRHYHDAYLAAVRERARQGTLSGG
jgi:uncharacterized protein